jgi:hypothetical protein
VEKDSKTHLKRLNDLAKYFPEKVPNFENINYTPQRRYILVQNEEQTAENSAARKAGYNNISEISRDNKASRQTIKRYKRL